MGEKEAREVGYIERERVAYLRELREALVEAVDVIELLAETRKEKAIARAAVEKARAALSDSTPPERCPACGLKGAYVKGQLCPDPFHAGESEHPIDCTQPGCERGER